MPRYALLIEYDGIGFVGWQRQTNGLSIQEILEAAASRLVAGTRIGSIVAGRTDAGVHAAGQVAHIDLSRTIAPTTLRDALNFHMKPHPVVILAVAGVEDGWNARFAAMDRTYRYRILNRRVRPALLRGRVWHVERLLDVSAMHEAATVLLGRHDFTSFRASSCQARNPTRTLDRLDVTREAETISITASARSFLHHQVRNMAGTLKLIGEGAWPIARMATALAALDRAAAGPTAPPDGLTFEHVRYDPDPFSS